MRPLSRVPGISTIEVPVGAARAATATPATPTRVGSRRFSCVFGLREARPHPGWRASSIHPNYADRHEPKHQPTLGGGPVVKINVNQAYATDGESWASFERWAREADVSTQRFVVRSDLACGSTIGPITAAELGIRTVDAGNPMLSMHSCREVAAAADVPKMIDVMKRFFGA